MGKKIGTLTWSNAQLRQDQYNPILKSLSTDCQNRMILRHLIKYGSITQEEAVDRYKAYRLSARIANLRDMGVNISTYIEDNNNRKGYHARYFLEEREVRTSELI